MQVDDKYVLDTVKNLALAAGSAKAKEHPIIKKLRAVGIYNSSCTGVALYGAAPDQNVSWEDLRAL